MADFTETGLVYPFHIKNDEAYLFDIVKNLSKTLLCLCLFWSNQTLAQRVGDFCMQDASGFVQALQCTVSDIQFVEVFGLNVIENCA